MLHSAELSTIICNKDKVSLLLEHADSCKSLKNLVKMGSQVTQEEDTTAKALGIKLISLADLEVTSYLKKSSGVPLLTYNCAMLKNN